MTMESIEKLRESSHLDDNKWTLETGEVVFMFGNETGDPNAVNWGEQWRRIADEIEAEIAERYMLLPCDADGVPIHVGDVMTLRHGKTCEVVAVSDSQFTANKMGCEKVVCHANLHRHVTPRTIEDVLADFASKQHGITKEENDALIAECAAEIRELMEVDA